MADDPGAGTVHDRDLARRERLATDAKEGARDVEARLGRGQADPYTALEGVKPANDDQRVGVEIVRKAIQWPAQQIAENAGLDGAVVVGKLLESKNGPTRPKAADTLAKPRIPSFTRRVRQDSAT
jgi:chaperonin GroEL